MPSPSPGSPDLRPGRLLPVGTHGPAAGSPRGHPPRSRGFLRLVGTTLLGVRGAASEGSPILNWGSDCSSSTRSVPADSRCESPGLCSASTSLEDLAVLQAWLAS